MKYCMLQKNQITSSTKFKDKKIVKIYMQLQNVNTSRYLEIENDILIIRINTNKTTPVAINASL